MEKIVMSLRIYPAEVRFEGVQVGMVYSADIKVKNIGNHNRKIRFLAPRDSQFKLNLNKDPIPLATGLQVTATVTFKPTKAEDVFEKMYVMVAKRKIEIPLIGLIPSCHLEIQTKINFGTVIANSKEICKSINISNHGTIPGSFGIKYTGVLPITIQPSNGIVKPKSSQTIKVYLCTDKPRIVSELAKVSLQGGEGTFLRIEAYIVQQIIELLDMYGEKILKCIQFGTTFFGTSRIEHAIIYNNSPNSMSWVAVMEHETVGEELGTNLQQRIDDTLYDLCYINKIRSIDVTTIISCIPNEGILLPYQKTVITFCFSPKLYENGKKYAGSSHRQDYALFLKFEAIESKDPFSKSAKGKAGESHSFHKVELALTGSGVPVLLNFVPGTDLEFTPCFMGQHSDILCRIENQSSLIPVTFSFHKVAHFKIIPEKGKIDEGSNQNVLFSFVPHQLGMFKVKQLIDILGSVAEDDFQSVKVKPFHQIELNFTSICKPITKRIEMKVIPGLTPLITNSTGQYVVDETGQYKNFAPVAMLQSHITSIHNHRLSKNLNKDALVAFPNDRSASLRSGDPRVEIRTIFTKVERYNYVDPEFAYTKEEQKQINENKDYYANFTNNLAKQRMLRKSEREFKRSDNAIDIGMAAERGLKSPHLSVTQLTEELTESQNLPLQEECLLITQNLVAKETESLKGKVVNLYKSPSTPQEKEDCNLTLTPKQLHQVVIGPSVLNFGDICVNYLCTKEIHVINNLHLNILVQLEIVHEELKKTNPSSYVIPPVSNTFIPILFEKNTLGTFWKSFSFTINNIPSGNILVKAVVKPVALELSAKEVVLRPIQGFLVKTGYRGTVRLYNRRNCAARFKWQPLVQENGIAFSIRPAKGIVEGYSALDCEVSWLPSYNSPEKGLFNLQVCNGNTLPLTCVVKIGATKVALLAHHVLFENCPQGLTTWKRTVLQNIGSHHAYFKICDQDLLPFITIKPSHGIIPVGGLTSLNIACTPYFSERFDTRAKVIIRHGNELDLRIGGFVDIADIVLSVSFFNFQGVYVGSKKVIRFLLNNKGTTRARVEFDLSHYKDFSLEFKDCEVFKDPKLLNAYAVELEEKKSMECGLAFSPKEVAAYDFSLPISVNFTESSTLSYLCSASQSFDTQLSSSLVPLIAPLVPPCTVKAIVLKPTLKLSSTEFFFDVSLNNQIPLDFFNEIQTNEGQILPLSPPSPTSNEKVLELISTSKEVVNWNLDLTYANKRVKDGTFTFSTLSGSLEPGEMSSIFINFCSMCPGIYTAEVPLHLKDDPVCYRLLSLKGTVRSPKLTFDPPLVFLTPVPLGIQTGIDIKIIPQNYLRKSSVYARVPTIKLYDGLMIDVLSVDFPNGKFIDVLPNGINTELISHISFKSMKPVSFSADVLFLDDENNWFAIQITAVAENCLLTVYPYLAYHLDDQKVILKQDEKQFYSNNEAPCLTCPLGALSSIYSTSTSSSDYESVQQKFGLSVDMVPENIPLPVTERSRPEDNEYVGMKQGQYFFPDEGRKEYLFFEKVLIAVETWFSLFGWSQGLNPISVPESIRRDVSKGQLSLPNLPKKQMNSNSEFARHNKTIYDMLAYLSGQMLPGVATTQTLPIDDTERVMHLHWQHSTLLTFLKTQGACLPYILPEFLLEPEDYKKWIKMKVASKGESEASETPDKYTLIIEDSKFEAMSKRVWTDVLLQTYKVLILSRVAPMSSTNMPTIDITKTPRIKPDFSSSNIYSKPERILLSWMNTNYENVRSKIWDNCNKGLPPPEKWIVNFDKDLLDGLVLATQVAAYCPFLIPKYFLDMYTCAQSPEQRLHNCLIVVKALHEVDLNIDIQATDICDPNPVLMLMFCVYLYENLPFYLPAKIIKFPCSLHSTVVRQLLLKNPSQKSLEYNAKIIGWDAADFSLPPEYKSVINIAPRDCVYINMEFTSRFLHPAEAVLMLISKTKSGRRGTTMTFALKAEVIDFKAMEIVKCKTPCYQWKEVTVNVKSPFQTVGEFSVNLVESSTFVFQTSQINELNKAAKDENTGCEANSVSTESGNDDEYFTQGKLLNSSIKCSFMKEFFCQVDSLFLDAKEPSSLSLHFLPFDLYKRYCVIIFTNKKIGEFIYIVEGTSTVPLPSRFLPINNPCILNYSHPPDEDLSKDDPVLHLKCDLNNVLELELKVPVVNNAKADALAFAAHQQMSSLEYERRKITGTLNSSSVRAAIALLGLTKLETHMLFHNTKSKSVLYSTELSLPEHFDIPKTIYIPPSPHRKLKTLQMEDASKYQQADFALLPLRFIPLTAGRYPCYILLLSPHDIRLFSIECVVNADFPDAKFQFETPAFEALTQNIPINNDTETEWKCIVTLEGDWFYGPSVLYVKSGETAQYPLTFKPILECEVTGSLKLRNQTDGIEHVFELRGIGKKPLPLDHAVIDCQVGKLTKKPIVVPNYTKDMLTYKVTSDLPMVWGCPRITIEPDNAISYILHICPWKRGIFKGAVSFVAEDRKRADLHEIDSEQSLQKWLLETSGNLDNKGSVSDVKVWFFLEINTFPAPPVETIEVTCATLDTIGIEISITNPKQKQLHLDVILTDISLSGESTLTLEPNETRTYVFKYSPMITGSVNESVVFQPHVGIEFWYLLKLTAEKPRPTTLPEIQCYLGKNINLTIPLVNTTRETLELRVINSNPINFLLDTSKKTIFIVPPHSTTEVPVQFYPSALGRANHQASFTFQCKQLKEWIFHLSGIGLVPVPLEPVIIKTCLGRHLSVIIPFRNPSTEHVLVDILLKDKYNRPKLPATSIDYMIIKSTGFNFTLKQTQEIPLPPKGTLDIPVLFVPHIMKLYEAKVIVQIVRANGEYWPYDNPEELGPGLQSLKRTKNGDISHILWEYPIKGIPIAPPPKTHQATLRSRARERVEETVHVLLTGVVFQSPEQRELVVIPKKPPVEDDQNQVPVNNDLPEVHEFQYEIQFESELMKSNLESCIALYLVKKKQNVENAVISLAFNIVFAPKKPIRSVITLAVQCSTDGIWNFPVTLTATEPDVDDVINIEGIGLFKESSVAFRLTSQTQYPESFTAYFLPGSDREFFVKPQMGELLPIHTAGTLISVGFKPQMYSRKHQATLVIQTENIYWMYQINGLPPNTVPPTNVAARIDSIHKNKRTIPVQQRNFIQENTKLITTGVSSTIKGAPLILRKQ